MARSERITQATERFVQAVKNEKDVDVEAAATALAQKITDEIRKSFSPFKTIEVPFIILSLRVIEHSIRQRFPNEAILAELLEKNASFISMAVRSGRKEE